MKNLLSYLPKPTTLLLVLFLGLIIGRCFTPVEKSTGSAGTGAEQASTEEAETTWTCSMHPSVMAPKPGDCPLCGMDLIPMETGAGDEANPHALRLADGQKAIAGIQTSVVARSKASHQVRLVGKLAVDETAIATLSAYVGGRLDRLYVDYTGLKVRAGDHLAEIYSPQLFHAQEELIVSVESAKRFGASSDASLAKISHATVIAARKKLALYGLTEAQMEEIVALGEPSEQITLNAPMGGTVIHRNAVEGQYVKEGDPLYTIADLDQLWLELDAYESDLPWIRYGQVVAFEVDAWPGETFEGTLSFLDPVLDPITRTVHVRVEVDNQDGRLRPEMYARARVETDVLGSGMAAPVDLNGKWMCPMHPEVVGEEEGSCTICGMPLETAESLGFLEEDPDFEDPLLIPITAPLLTGDRAIVFVEIPDREQHGANLYEARDVVLGPRAGETFVVLDGLEEGEVIVSRGAFTIDSELQLRGKTSMMAPDGGGAGGHQHGGTATGPAVATHPHEMEFTMETADDGFRTDLGVLLKDLAAVGEGLASDDLASGKSALKGLTQSLADLDRANAPASAQEPLDALEHAIHELQDVEQLETFRIAFQHLQKPMVEMASTYGYLGTERPMAIYHCPMALEDGGDWIDFAGDGVRNPYYGSGMLKCGSEKRTIPSHEGH